MMERIIATTHKLDPSSSEKERSQQTDTQIFLRPKRISDDSRDVEMCDNKTSTSDTDEDLNVDVENDDDTSCPVDLTRRQDKFTSFENLISAPSSPPSNHHHHPKTDDSSSDFICFKETIKRRRTPESVCSDDDVSRSASPRDDVGSPSVVPHNQNNRRLAFSVENILDPNKFTGRQGVYSDGICCWKPLDGSRASPEYDDSETGEPDRR